jgi:hypothetical protein
MVDIDDEEKAFIEAARVAKDRALRATPQFKEALKIISPARQHRPDCETDIADALMSIEFSHSMYARRSPAEKRELLQKLAKTLRGAVNLVDQLDARDWWDLPGDLIPERLGDLKTCLKEIEAVADAAQTAVKKGAPRYNDARADAVGRAHQLLTKYSKRPGCSRVGPWHDLARVLIGDDGAELFDYMIDYMKKLPQP